VSVSSNLVVFLSLVGFSLAQATAPSTSQNAPVATFRAHADLVLIPVTVTDRLNRFVLGLQKSDFHLYENAVEQNVALFSGDDAPLSIGLLFDASGSMGPKLGKAREALFHLALDLRQRNRHVEAPLELAEK